MTEEIRDVGKFHKKYLQDSHNRPTIPTEKQKQMRIKFLLEEVKELEQAYQNNDIVNIADALGDIIYVALGAVHEAGLKNEIKKIVKKIHTSNMTKACSSKNVAMATIKKYKQSNPEWEYSIQTLQKNVCIVVNNYGKVIKSIRYRPVDLNYLKNL